MELLVIDVREISIQGRVYIDALPGKLEDVTLWS